MFLVLSQCDMDMDNLESSVRVDKLLSMLSNLLSHASRSLEASSDADRSFSYSTKPLSHLQRECRARKTYIF